MSDKRDEYLSAAAARLRKTGTAIANAYGVRSQDFADFKVAPGEEPCCVCDVGNHTSAPVQLCGKHYSVWCALDIARELAGLA